MRYAALVILGSTLSFMTGDVVGQEPLIVDAMDAEGTRAIPEVGSNEFAGETCWYCDHCSEDELFVDEDEFPGWEAKILSYLGGDPPECIRTESDCHELLQCTGGGGTDAKEEDTELLEAMELATLLSAGRWSAAELLIRSRPASVEVVQDRRLLLVRGPQCIGGVYALFVLLGDQLDRLGAVQ